MFKLLSHLLRERRFLRRFDQIVRDRNQLFGSCPFCGVGLGTHPFRDLASAQPWRANSEWEPLQHAIAARDWLAASHIIEFRATEEAVVIHVIKCPSSSRAILFTLESHFELSASDRILAREPLTADETTALAALIVAPWSTPEDALRSINVTR